MQTVSFYHKKKKKKAVFTGPESWDELHPEQFLMVIKAREKVSDVLNQAWILCKLFFAIPDDLFKSLTQVQAFQLASCVNFIFERRVYINKWILKKIKVGKTVYHGPSDTLENICFAELMYADSNFQKYQRTKNIVFLDRLISILYRVADYQNFEKTGDIREPFNQAHIERRAAELKELPDTTKSAILLNYIGCRSVMAKPFKYVFPLLDENEEVQEDKPATNGSWLEVGIQLARKEHALGTFDELENKNSWLVLKVLDKVIEEAEELQAHMDSLK